jgi:hypothetical protein
MKAAPPVKLSDWWCEHCGTPYCGLPRCSCCGGNAARAARLRLQLGTRIQYLRAAMRVDGTGRAAHFASFIAMMDRRFDKVSRRWVRAEVAGYCLDAPDDMPGGACHWVEVPEAREDSDAPGDPVGYVSQVVVYREPPS